MKIILFYDNFVRDFRGLLYLKQYLCFSGADVLVHPLWMEACNLMDTFEPDLVVFGQLSESQTSKFGKYAFEKGIKIVVNSSEALRPISRMQDFFRYNCTEWNDSIVDLQILPCCSAVRFLVDFGEIENKKKYKALGFPRFDLLLNKSFLAAEREYFIRKLPEPKGKRILFVSGLLFPESVGAGVSQDDEKVFDLDRMNRGQAYLSEKVMGFLEDLSREKPNDQIIVKKHPWDDTEVLEQRLSEFKNILVIGNDFYIVPCIQSSDIVVHTSSTAAFDAWILGKPTISYLPENLELGVEPLNHMQYEIIGKSPEAVISALNNYPKGMPARKGLTEITGHLDGFATLRLACEILKLLEEKLRIRNFSKPANYAWHTEYLENFLKYFDAEKYGLRVASLARMEKSRSDVVERIEAILHRSALNNMLRYFALKMVRKRNLDAVSADEYELDAR